MKSQSIEPPEPDTVEGTVNNLFKQRNEIIDLFVRTFITTEIKDYEYFKTGSLELTEKREIKGTEVGLTYMCHFIPYKERRERREKLLDNLATQDLLKDNLQNTSTEELINELKKRGLGVFNLSLPFHYIPKNETTKTRRQRM